MISDDLWSFSHGLEREVKHNILSGGVTFAVFCLVLQFEAHFVRLGINSGKKHTVNNLNNNDPIFLIPHVPGISEDSYQSPTWPHAEQLWKIGIKV